ncbi:MAG: NAD(P)H-binding protein [Myxococcales bacterium]|nr:NAD(P)H-binding protein [Myxococcales bacterium]
MSNAKDILVVGASGTVASNVISALASTGQSVRAGTRNPAKQASQEGVTWVELDIDRPSTVQAAFAGARRAFLLSPPGYANQYPILSQMIAEAKKNELEKVVMMTAMGVDADPSIPFRRAELELEGSGLRYNIVRPTWFMQNFNTFWRHGIVAAHTIALPAADGKVGFVDARDISQTVAGLLLDDTHDNQAFDLTGPEAITHAQAAEILAAATGLPIRYENVSPESFKQTLLQVGLPADYADLLVQLFAGVRAGWANRTTPSVERVTGKPPRSLQTYAHDYKQSWL